MSQIQLSSNLDSIKIDTVNIALLKVKKNGAQKLGLLNHRTLDPLEGILFSNCRVFHTFGMNFPISIFAFNKKKQLITTPIEIEPNKVFICPKRTKYVVESHHKYSAEYDANNIFKKKILLLSPFVSKIIYLLVKSLPSILILFSLGFTVGSVFALNTLDLTLGQARTINLENAPQTIQIDDPEIIDLERIGISNSIKITPKQPGQTKLTFQYLEDSDEILIINVSILPEGVQNLLREHQNDDSKSTPEFENSLKKIKQYKTLEHTVSAGKIFIFGLIKTIDDFQNLSKIVAAYPKAFFPSFEINPDILNLVIDSLNKDIRVFGDHNLQIIKNGIHIFLKGTFSSDKQKEKIWSYLSAVFPNIIDATNPFYGDNSLVQVNFEFFEVGTGYKKEAGLQYPTLGSSGSGMSVITENFHKPLFQITPFSVFFRALATRNYVREIAKPVIMTRSGEKASFLAGGEVPIPAVTVNATSTNASVTYKSVGILFDIVPNVNDDGTIWLKLNAEYSQINEALSYQKTPGFNSRKISTNIILKEGCAAIISGLIQNTDIKKNEYLPLLSKIPVLGEFFKNKQNGHNSTELWIAVSATQKRNF